MLTVLTGRSRRLWPRIIQEIGAAHSARTLESPGRLLLLVPGQYTLQAELDLIDRLNLPGFMDIDVLSPARLITRVFALAGSPGRVRIDGRGKAMMLADVLLASQRELSYYGGAAARRGFADRLATAIGDFKRAGLDPDGVAALADRLDAKDGLDAKDALAAKLNDLALLYRRYEARLEGAFLDGEDAQEALLERLPGSGLLAHSHVFIYGFDLITPQFLRQLAVMARGAESVRLALTLENEAARDGAAFAPARDTLARLARHFDLEGLLWEREHVATPLPSKPAIQWLEQELFAVPQKPFEGDDSPITLLAASDPYGEATHAAAALLRHAREGIPFDEMEVVVGDLSAYAGAIEMVFARAGIPYHLAEKRPALAHPLIRSWLAALRCVTRQWRAEDALTWLKGGFCGLTRDEAERLENHAIENGLQGAKWRRPIEDMELEAFRARFTAPLEALQARLRGARDATGTLAAVYGLLEDVGAYATLAGWEGDLAARGLHVQAADCAQVWRLALETLDQLHALLHGQRQPMASVAQVIEAGLSQAELGALPASPGAVQVGQLGHVKLGGACRVLFLMGFSDGVLRPAETSLLSDAEAEHAAALTGSDAAFGLRGDALAQLMQINLLDTLAAPSQRLYISHAMAGTGGEALRPAAALKLIRRVFPQMKERGETTRGQGFIWHAPGAALDTLGPMLRTAAARGFFLEAERDAAAWLVRAPQTRGQAERVVRQFLSPTRPAALTRRSASTLYAHTRTSVSRLESFANCPYRHFVAYGLRPRPRRAFDIARDETGTFYHRAIERFTKAAAALPAWPNITHEENNALMQAALAPLVAEWETTPLNDNAMQRAAGEAFCRIARRAAWVFTRQMQRGSFRPKVIEAHFGPGEALPPIGLTPEGGYVRLAEGRIDRIDFFEQGQDSWLRVVDYKSGGAALELSRVYGGLQLQLLLYLKAAQSAFPGVHAAGAFYSRFHDPLVETDSRDPNEIERLLEKEVRLKGVVLADEQVLSALEDGDAAIKRGALDRDDIDALMRHAHAQAERFAGQIDAGEIAAHPARLDKWSACAWCDYLGICGFDPTVEGNTMRRIEKLSREEALGRMRGK